jgi:hypothetical protein
MGGGRDEHLLEDDSLLDSGCGSSITGMGPPDGVMGSGGARLGPGPGSRTHFSGPGSGLGPGSLMGNTPQPLLQGGVTNSHNVARYFHFSVRCFCSVANKPSNYNHTSDSMVGLGLLNCSYIRFSCNFDSNLNWVDLQVRNYIFLLLSISGQCSAKMVQSSRAHLRVPNQVMDAAMW